MVRRLILALTVVLLNGLLVIQFEIVALNIITAFVLLGYASPFNDPFHTRLCMFNEICTLVLLYHFMCFTPFVQDIPTRLLIGLSFCIVESLNIIINLIFVFTAVIRNLVFDIKLFIAKRSLTKQKAAMKEGPLRRGIRAQIFKRKT